MIEAMTLGAAKAEVESRRVARQEIARRMDGFLVYVML
jgi:hypothetical protein